MLKKSLREVIAFVIGVFAVAVTLLVEIIEYVRQNKKWRKILNELTEEKT